jgi:hypothetical protein
VLPSDRRERPLPFLSPCGMPILNDHSLFLRPADLFRQEARNKIGRSPCRGRASATRESERARGQSNEKAVYGIHDFVLTFCRRVPRLAPAFRKPTILARRMACAIVGRRQSVLLLHRLEPIIIREPQQRLI